MTKVFIAFLLSLAIAVDSYSQEVEELQIEETPSALEEDRQIFEQNKQLQKEQYGIIQEEVQQVMEDMQVKLEELQLEKMINCAALIELGEVIPSTEEMQSCMKQVEKAMQNIQEIDMEQMQK